MHVGLNLVYLVPGEIGGMETYARELIPALIEERPDLKLTAFINREAHEAGDGPWGELIPSVTLPVRRAQPRRVGARRAAVPAARRGGCTASTSSTRSRRPRPPGGRSGA